MNVFKKIKVWWVNNFSIVQKDPGEQSSVYVPVEVKPTVEVVEEVVESVYVGPYPEWSCLKDYGLRHTWSVSNPVLSAYAYTQYVGIGTNAMNLYR